MNWFRMIKKLPVYPEFNKNRYKADPYEKYIEN